MFWMNTSFDTFEELEVILQQKEMQSSFYKYLDNENKKVQLSIDKGLECTDLFYEKTWFCAKTVNQG